MLGRIRTRTFAARHFSTIRRTSLPGALSGQPLYFEAYVADPSGGVDVTDPVPAEEV